MTLTAGHGSCSDADKTKLTTTIAAILQKMATMHRGTLSRVITIMVGGGGAEALGTIGSTEDIARDAATLNNGSDATTGIATMLAAVIALEGRNIRVLSSTTSGEPGADPYPRNFPPLLNIWAEYPLNVLSSVGVTLPSLTVLLDPVGIGHYSGTTSSTVVLPPPAPFHGLSDAEATAAMDTVIAMVMEENSIDADAIDEALAAAAAANTAAAAAADAAAAAAAAALLSSPLPLLPPPPPPPRRTLMLHLRPQPLPPPQLC